jgi:class 3 adenylate cyclase
MRQDEHQALQAFEKAGLLAELSETEQRQLIRALKPRPEHFHDNQVLCEPRKKEDRLWILTKGSVDVKEQIEGEEWKITSQNAGNIIGELALFDRPGIEPAIVKASGSLETLAVFYDKIKGLKDRLKGPFVWNLARVISNKLDASRIHRAGGIQKEVYHEQLLRRFLPASGIAANRVEVSPRHIREDVVIYFSDIAGFSDIAEKVKPSDLAKLVRDFLTPQVEAIEAHDGEVDKFIGDAVMAWWTIRTKEKSKETCSNAFQAALKAVSQVSKIPDPRKRGTNLSIRIGLHVGKAQLGNYGSKTRTAFTLIGRDVNIAARLEQARKPANRRDVPLGPIRVSDKFAKLLAQEQRQRWLPHPTTITVKNTTEKIWYNSIPGK